MSALTIVALGWWAQRHYRTRLSTIKSVVTASLKATQSPSTKALRELGCLNAMVYPPEDVGALIRWTGRQAPDKGSDLDASLVNCMARANSRLTCARVARVHVRHAPTEPFMVMLQFFDAAADERTACIDRFSANGVFERSMMGKKAPRTRFLEVSAAQE